MTPTPDRPTFWTPTNVMGFFLTACGVALGAWSKATDTLTSPTLIAVGLLVGAGMWFVNSPLAAGFAHEAREIVPGFLTPRVTARSEGEMSVAAPPGASVTVTADEAPPAAPDVVRERATPVPHATPTLRLTTLPDPPVPPKRRRRATDPAPVTVPPTEVQPQSESPLDGVNREDG